MTATTMTRKRPTDAALEAAREAVIQAARETIAVNGFPETDSAVLIQQHAVEQLEAIEAARAVYPAILEDGLSGWEIPAMRVYLRECGWTRVPTHLQQPPLPMPACRECDNTYTGFDEWNLGMAFKTTLRCNACGHWWTVTP